MPLSEVAEPRGAAAQRSPRPSPSTPLPCLGCSFCLLAPVLEPSMKSVVSASASGASCMVLRAVLGGAAFPASAPSPPFSSLCLLIFVLLLSFLPCRPPERCRGKAQEPGGVRGARAGGAQGAGGRAWCAGRTGRDGTGTDGPGRGSRRLPACLLSLAFRLSPRRAGGRELPAQFKKGRAP